MSYVAIQTALGLLGLWFFVFYFWRDYRVDAFRDHVFSIRERLFLYAAQGGVSFSDPAYTILRYRMNVVLRYAHQFSLTRFLLAVIHPSPARNSEHARFEMALQRLSSDATRAKLREFNTILAIGILQFMVYRSFFLYLLVRPIMPFVPTRKVINRSPNVVSGVEQVESGALQEEEAKKHPDDCDVAVVA